MLGDPERRDIYKVWKLTERWLRSALSLRELTVADPDFPPGSKNIHLDGKLFPMENL